ncbi:hypothetical protein [Cucumibacter marinus]|uniref:hypothetical protein n=1 Tax=Cucumibacter marinus TaxID=1121252 RepID=UPI00040EDC44|nr:hypothetical protein [Cucumibacter marinus]
MLTRILAVLLVVLVAAALIGGVIWSGASDAEIDVMNPPPEAVQVAWRTEEGRVMLQYTYTAPNGCWQEGDFSVDPGPPAKVTITPEIIEGACIQVLTPLAYTREIDLPAEAETLTVTVEHPASGVIETNELWIAPDEATLKGEVASDE